MKPSELDIGKYRDGIYCHKCSSENGTMFNLEYNYTTDLIDLTCKLCGFFRRIEPLIPEKGKLFLYDRKQ